MSAVKGSPKKPRHFYNMCRTTFTLQVKGMVLHLSVISLDIFEENLCFRNTY